MSGAYYNEIDPFCAKWLRRLCVFGLIADGEVDERSIEDVKPDDLRGFDQHHFFAGIGVWSYALRRAGWADERPVWTGSCPCQPFSQAGKRAGVADERHLWPAWDWLISQCRPDVVLGEQVASKDGLAWFDLVQADMEGKGYAGGAQDLCVAGVGGPHIRQRLFYSWLLDDDSQRLQRRAQPDFRPLEPEQPVPRRNDAGGSSDAGGLSDRQGDGRPGRADDIDAGGRECALGQDGATGGTPCASDRGLPPGPRGSYGRSQGEPARHDDTQRLNAEVARIFIEEVMALMP